MALKLFEFEVQEQLTSDAFFAKNFNIQRFFFFVLFVANTRKLTQKSLV